MSAASDVVGIDMTANAAVKRILLEYADMALPLFINAGERPAHMSRSRVDAVIFARGDASKKNARSRRAIRGELRLGASCLKRTSST